MTSSRAGSGFESGGALDTSAPCGSLAGLTDAVTRDGRLADLDDDELIGVLRAWRRLESWCTSGLLAVMAELARRRPEERTAPAPAGSFPAQLSEFIADELAAALTLSVRTAGTYLDQALDQEIRLPGTARALHKGLIDQPKARLIAETTRILSNDDAHAVESRILPAAVRQTLGQLRAALARAVLAVDPQAAARRREEAQKDPRVRRWQEDAGTAALAGYGLPPADVLAADQRLDHRARVLRDAGLPGSLEELRARVYLDALLGQDSTPPANPHQATNPGQPPNPDQRLTPGPPRAPSAQSAAPEVPRRLAARVTLTVPLLTQLGLAAEPGHVAGFGPIDPALARELGAMAAADPRSRFCVTVTGPDGQAIGHGCLPGRPPDLNRPGSTGFTVMVSPLAGGDCDHRHQESGYQPSRKLQHLIWARTPTCTAPGCRRSAVRCDLDHTTPYDQGGRTCECNLAPLCRHHHRCKQSQGWRLEQIRPGVMRWTTPAGHRYVTAPGSG
ncbi:MAG TPA: DUF222 domain-containing protein [Streptosporangiaceae bacterium]|nr:DUF222 domain-containing protein [Streptosporangiaceae bacterium]